MKFNKNNFQIIILLIVALSLILTMFSVMDSTRLLYIDNELVLSLAITLVASLCASYVFLVIRRINPKQYIYVSYTNKDKDMVCLISQILDEQFMRLSKYRYEIITTDTIPFGDDMAMTMKNYIEKSSIVIVIVSKDYLESEWCLNEFWSITNMNKRIIPIVLDSYDDLSKLPKDISNIKALSLKDCVSDKDFEMRLLHLARDLVKNRNY